MKHPDQYASIFCFFIGGTITASSFFYGVGSLAEPGPGFITFLSGLFLTLLSIALYVASGKSPEGRIPIRQIWAGKQTGKAFFVMGLLVLYLFLLVPLGFLITTCALLFFLFRVQSQYSVATLLLLSVLTTGISFLIFDQWLWVQLPRGFLGYW